MTRKRAALLAALVLLLLTGPLKHAVALFLPDAAVDPVPHCIAVMAMSVALFGGASLLLWPWRPEGPQGRKRIAFPAAILVGLLCRAVCSPLDEAWQSWLQLSPSALPRPDGAAEFALYALSLAVVPALTEEAFFRGALLGTMGCSCAAILLVSLLFALMHGSWAALPSTLTIGLALTLLMARTKRLAAPILAHLAYNLTALI